MSVASAPMLWESLWAPYDQPTYDWVLARLEPADVILDIGAGDLRLARQMAHLVRHVYAIEINPALNIHNRVDLPANLTLIEGDALRLEFPPDITGGVLLMRHCTHFREYAEKLSQAGANRLFTNARWGMGVECVDLITPRQAYAQLSLGWYACWCGNIGFKPGPAEALTCAALEHDHQVSDCPACCQKYQSRKILHERIKIMPKPHIIVIGAGFTGVALAHDLALRGCEVTVVERGPIANGTSGRTHGLLHSGGRYAVTDQESAIECIDENMILRRIVPSVIEPNGGLFVALNESDLAYSEDFIAGCEACHIPFDQLTPKQALDLEPNLNPGLLAAFSIPDGTFDPLRLALAFAATARKNGAKFKLYHEARDLLLDGLGNVIGVKVLDLTSNKEIELHGDTVINATGAWVGEITAMAGADVPIRPTPGIMVAFERRATQRALNRLCLPADGDIIVPQRRMSVIGTTSFAAENLDYIPITDDQIDLMLERAAELLPVLSSVKMRGIYMATRPLIGGGTTGRSIARTFKCFNHKETHNVDGFVTITGGKATTMRQMAEKTADIVMDKLGLQIPCQTMDYPLISYREFYALNN